MTLSQAKQKTLSSYLADGETAITACTRGSVTYLLTDRRFFTYNEEDNGTITVTSQFLDGLGGVNIQKKEGNDLNTDSLAVGLIALFTGLVSLALQAQMPEGIAAVFIMIGAAGLISGIIALIYAFDTEEGQISVQLRTQEGEVAKSLQLHETSLEFAEAISKAASNAHTPDEEHVKKVST
ncbi:hypothetical protein [Natronorubrum thiooxidans]|uniref:Uncharacterized protein n=1 Tax=Natronorubrum thiooxidans TaxID=308853 RepID=A0A1N7GQH9_9EURY|nr:hypothetical protein [Natronorubrum thiooxidans]SIS14718.1 hypothetical protein SAMN05421752_11446 [Natronorubrum thiooxidans]